MISPTHGNKAGKSKIFLPGIAALIFLFTCAFFAEGFSGNALDELVQNVTFATLYLKGGVTAQSIAALYASDDIYVSAGNNIDAGDMALINTTHNNATLPVGATMENVSITVEYKTDAEIGDDAGDYIEIWVGENSSGIPYWNATPAFMATGAAATQTSDITRTFNVTDFIDSKEKAEHVLISLVAYESLGQNADLLEDRAYVTISYQAPGDFVSPTEHQEFMGNETVQIEFNETLETEYTANVTFLINGTIYQGLNTTANGNDYWIYNWTVPGNLQTGNHAITAQMRNSSGAVLGAVDRTITITPRLDSVSVSAEIVKGAEQVIVIANNENDPDNGTLTLYCSDSITPDASNYNCTNSDSTPPYSLACSFYAEADSAAHTKYCRVYNGKYYSKNSEASYTTDSAPPATYLNSVAGDTSVPYYDTADDGYTNISVSGEENMSCRYSLADNTYTEIGAIGQDCITAGAQAVCPIGAAQGTPDYYVSCIDKLGNEQNTSYNIDVTSITVDWTAPSTSDNSDMGIHVPTYTVTITESDNIDGDPGTYYCIDTAGTCTPADELVVSAVTFNSTKRGLNYLRYYSADYAGNNQSVQNKTININRLPVLDSASDDAGTVKGGSIINITTASLDPDAQQITLYVCNQTGANSSGCTYGEYCNATGTANISCAFYSQADTDSHTWHAYTYDTLGEAATGNPVSGAYTTDSDAPDINILYPQNITYTSGNVSSAMTSSESADWASYCLDSCAANITMSSVTATYWTAAITGLSDGQHYLKVYANDTYGNTGTSPEVYFTVNTTVSDSTPPAITITSPSNGTHYNSTAVPFSIVLDEAGAWAGYSVDGGGVQDMGNSSALDWNSTVVLDEADHNVTFYANDSAGNMGNTSGNVIYFSVDATAPQFSSANRSPYIVNDNESVTCLCMWEDNLGLSTGIIGENSSGTFVNHAFILSGTSKTLNFTIPASELEPGAVECMFYANDTTGNANSTSISFIVNDATPPSLFNITYSPSSESDLDPGVRINISADAADNHNLTSVILQYREYDSPLFENFTMNNTYAGHYEGNFTPGVESTWIFRILAFDSSANRNISAETNLSIAQDKTWGLSDSIPSVKSIVLTDNRTINLGNMTITNTGDFALNFSLGANVGWISFNGTGNGTASFSLECGNSETVSVIADTEGFSVGLYNYTLLLSTSYNGLQVGSNTTAGSVNIQNTAGPYLVLEIDTYSAAVSRGQEGVVFSSSLRNLGTADATGVWLAWELPPELVVETGIQNRSLGNLPVGVLATNPISLKVVSSVDKNVTINATSNSTQGAGDKKSKTVSIGDPVIVTNVIIETIVTGGGISSSAPETKAFIEKILTDEKFLNSTQTVELLRGRGNSFSLEIKNIFDGATLFNISVKIEGYMSKYLSVYPRIIDEIRYNEKKAFNITILSPDYIEKGNYHLTVIVTGKLEGMGIKSDLTETREVEIIIHTVSREDAGKAVQTAAFEAMEMQGNGFAAKKVFKLLDEAKAALENGDYESAAQIAEEISAMKDNALEARGIIDTLSARMKSYSSFTGAFLGIQRNFPEAQHIMALAEAALEREDYETALDRAKDAQMALAVESKEFSFLFFMLEYWWIIILAIILLSVAGFLGYEAYMRATISQKIRNLEKEEESLAELMKDLQKKYYMEKTIGEAAFQKAMHHHRNRISRIRQARTTLRHKRTRLLNPGKALKDLREEKSEVKGGIKKLQKNYFLKGMFGRAAYSQELKTYTERLAEIDDEEMTIDQLLRKKKHKKGKDVNKKAALLCFIIMAAFFPANVLAQNITREDALAAIQRAELDILEMSEEGFSTAFVKDSLESAYEALERADFADSIRKNATGELAETAKRALEGMDYERFTYTGVLEYTEEIKSRKEQAYLISDSIKALEYKADECEKQSVDTLKARQMLENARVAFEMERYLEAGTFLSQARIELEEKQAEQTKVRVLLVSGKSFVEKNWPGLSIVSAMIFLSGLLAWKKTKSSMLRKKIMKLRAEEKALVELLKKTQTERFKKASISEAIYEMRMDKYSRRLDKIKETLPVLESMRNNKNPAKYS